MKLYYCTIKNGTPVNMRPMPDPKGVHVIWNAVVGWPSALFCRTGWRSWEALAMRAFGNGGYWT